MTNDLRKPRSWVRCRTYQFASFVGDRLLTFPSPDRLLVLAGVDTTTNGMTQLMLLLSEHPEIQEKMRLEIRQAQVQHGEDIPYDTLVTLPYMDAVCRESMRL